MTERLAVFASGGGSNLDAILRYLRDIPAAPVAVRLVIADRPCGALAKAAEAGIPTSVVDDPRDGEAMVDLLARHDISIVALAGYLRLVPMQVTVRYAGRMVNIHPALLPRHGGPGMYGRRVHAAVLAAGDAESGATVHFVDPQYDRGAPIAWARVPVEPDDTIDTLAARVLRAEHFLFPRVLHAVAAGAIRLGGHGAVIVTGAATALVATPPDGVTLRFA